MATRDFRAETKANFKNNLVDPDPNWDAFFDWWKDVWFDDVLKEDLTNFDSYMAELCEINDYTSKKIDEIWDKVHEIEREYAGQFYAIRADIGATCNRSVIDAIAAIKEETRFVFSEAAPLMRLYEKEIGGELTPEDIQAKNDKYYDFLIAQYLKYLNGEGGLKMEDCPLTPEQIQLAREEVAKRVKAGLSDELINQYDAYPTTDDRNIANDGYMASFGPTACYATCLLLVAHIFGFDIIMWDLINADIVSKYDGEGLMDPVDYYLMERRKCATEAEYSEAIYNALAHGYPVIVELQGHFVVAVAADGCASFEDIWVMDPADGKRKKLSEAEKDYGDRPVIGIRICTPKPTKEEGNVQ